MRDEERSKDLSIAAQQYMEEKDYWLAKMSGELVKSGFPYDYKKNTALHSADVGSREVNIIFPAELMSRLISLSKGYDYTLNMILTAAVKLLLAKYTGNWDIILGAPIYKQEGSEEGEFINTVLALRTQLNRDMSIKELLLQVRQTTLEADKHQNYPIETLLYHLNMPFSGEEDDFPLFDVIVMLENIHDRRYIQHIPFHVLFSFERTGELVQGIIQYHSSLYRKETAERIVTHFLHVLTQFQEDIHIKIGDIELLSETEKEQLIKDFNRTETEYPRDKMIHELFANQVERIPGTIAVVGTHQPGEEGTRGLAPLSVIGTVTYGELNKKSDQLTHLLKERGIRPDTIVGLMTDRCVEMIIGILGILKAGGAYLPIDPDYPQERINYMLTDSNASILLTRKDIVPSPSTLTLASTCQVSPTNLAYIIYTSGSTGRPKGVMIGHQSVNNLVSGLKQRIYNQYQHPLRVALLAPFVFDASVKQVFAPLLLGHCLYIIPGDIPFDVNALIYFYKKYAIDISDGTPTHIKLLSESEGDMAGIVLKHFIIGGEPLTKNTAAGFFKRFKQHTPKITNVYGPTECCVDSTSFEATKENIETYDEIPIGRPMPNHRVYIVSKENQLQPVGTPGELCISGDGVARGYMNNPELTSDKFLSRFNRSYMSHWSYIYKTGDLARWLWDGNIEFLGRTDHQVKIRGYRIELGEIENRLICHPAIKEAIVITKQDQPAQEYLCAYILPAKPGENTDGLQLREYLAGQLPFYMIPSCFVPIDTIPLTPNGKVDRNALKMMELDTTPVYVGPGDDIEKRLVEIWTGILKQPGEISIDDNFFRMGGHSLTATILVSRIHKAFDVKVPLQEIFRSPFIREIARYIKNQTHTSKYISIKPVEEKEYYELSSAQRRLYYLQQLDPGSKSYNLVLIYKLEGNPDREKLQNIFKRLIKRHEGLRTAFRVIDNQPRQRIYPGEEVEFQVDYYEMSGEETVEYEKEFITVFDLGKLPLLKVCLIKLNSTEKQYKLLVNSHHIISDGTSQTILIKEFMALYSSRELTPLPIRFKDFSQWQNSNMEKEFMKSQGHYWLRQFEGEPPVVNLPTDFERPARRSFEGERVTFRVNRQETVQLKEMAAREDITLYTLMLAVYTVFIYKLTGQEDIVVGTPQAGRRHTDLEPLVGMFVNLLAMRNFPKGEKSFKQFLKEVKKNTLQALQNQDYIFEELVKNVVKKSDPSRNPLFDTVFVVQNLDFPGIEIPGLKLLPYSYFDRVSKFDLALFAVETDLQLEVFLEYCTRLFRPKTIQRFISNFNEVLAAILENEGVLLKDIRITHGLASVESTVTEIEFDI
jgi:fengycin family lipopeptide synthetase D